MSFPSLEVRAAAAAEWDDAWTGCRHSTYFQSRGWAECWSAYTSGVDKPDPVSIRISRGQRIVLPMSRQRRHAGLSSRRLLSPAGGPESACGRASHTSRYGEALFEALRRRGSPDVELRLAVLHEETIMAGGLCLYGPRHVYCWHAVALSEFFELRAANLLVHELLLDVCGRSLEWFDLNPSAGLEGVQTFKQRVGARLVKGSRQKHA